MSAKHACNAQTYTRTKAGASPAAKAASLVLAAGLALPTVLPTLAHAQNASNTQESTPSLHKATEVNSRSTAALIRQSLQNAKTAAEHPTTMRHLIEMPQRRPTRMKSRQQTRRATMPMPR